jgi:hypothetical protein
MPKRIYIPKDAKHSGVDVTWTRSAQRLDIGGWYDSFVGIQGDSMTLREFFDALGITEKDCAKAWKQSNAELTGDQLAGRPV